MYAIGMIDEGGFIYASWHGNAKVMHKETRVTTADLPYATLASAKEDFVDPESSEFILDYNEEGGVESLWCLEASEEVIRTRLKIWSGCYGAWRVRRLNETVPTV